MGTDPISLVQRIETEMSKYVKVQGSEGQLYISADFNEILEKGFKIADKMGDEYLSLEHIFLAVLKKNIEKLFFRQQVLLSMTILNTNFLHIIR